MRTILVPTDFSGCASNAVVYAVNLAKAFKAKVMLLHAYHPKAGDYRNMEFDPEGIHRDCELKLKKCALEMIKKTGVEVVYSAKMGLAVDVIIEEEMNYDLVIMGMKGRGGSGGFWGSIATTTVKKSRKPVMLIPENARYRLPERIVCACEYDSAMKLSFPFLKEFTQVLGGKIDFLNINPGMDEILNRRLIRREIEETLGKNNVEYHFRESKDIITGISEFAHQQQADLMAIFPRRYFFLDKLMHKSISREMAFRTDIPLLALHYNRTNK